MKKHFFNQVTGLSGINLMQVSDKKQAGSLYLLRWGPEYKISPREALARATHASWEPGAALSSRRDRLNPTSTWFCHLVTA